MSMMAWATDAFNLTLARLDRIIELLEKQVEMMAGDEEHR